MKTEQATHTPGPWYPSRCTHSWDIASESDGATVAHAEDDANARLIAAGPDLLAACKACYSALLNETGVGVCSHEKKAAALAIAKAEGRE